MISGFRRDADKNRALLCCYATNNFNSLPTFRENILATLLAA
jgi:hypothetical protein